MPGLRRTDQHEALAQMLRDRRQAAGISQEELAARIGRKQSYISKLEQAERRLDAVELLEVVDAIGCAIGPIFDELRAARDAERQAHADAAKRRGSAPRPRKGAIPATSISRPRRQPKSQAD